MSMDSQFNPLGDFTRAENEPNNRYSPQAVNTVSDFSLKQNSLFTNVIHNIKDLVLEMRQNASYFDVRGQDLDKTCEQIIS